MNVDPRQRDLTDLALELLLDGHRFDAPTPRAPVARTVDRSPLVQQRLDV